MSITFMAKFDEREGNSATSTARSPTRTARRLRRPTRGVRPLPGRPARLPARDDAVPRAEHQLLQALRAGSFAPTAVAWGDDNRTCSLRVVGHGAALRIENRAARRRRQPYLALAAMIAAGLHGIDEELELEPAWRATPTTSDKPRVPDNAARRRGTCSPQRASPARRSGRRSSTTTSTARGSSSRRSRRRSQTGSGSGDSSGCEPAARRRHLRSDRAGAVGSLGHEVGLSPRRYSRGRSAPVAQPVLLPASAARTEAPGEVLDLLDGLLLAGGGDMDPAGYGAAHAAQPSTPGLSATRSRWRSPAPRWSATCPSWGSAGGCR